MRLVGREKGAHYRARGSCLTSASPQQSSGRTTLTRHNGDEYNRRRGEMQKRGNRKQLPLAPGADELERAEEGSRRVASVRARSTHGYHVAVIFPRVLRRLRLLSTTSRRCGSSSTRQLSVTDLSYRVWHTTSGRKMYDDVICQPPSLYPLVAGGRASSTYVSHFLSTR